MGFIPQITCRHCGKSFSAVYNRCPHCGTRRVKQTTRTPSTTSSARQGTAANARAQANARFQLIFGCILLVAVIASVIILIAAGVKGGSTDRTKKGDTAEDPEFTTPTDLAEPTPTPTPTPTPEPEITSIGIYFLGEENTGFVTKIGESVPLAARTFPTDVVAEVTWTSNDTSVCTVDSTGLVTGVGVGSTNVVLSCGSKSAECLVIVKAN